MIKQIRGFVGSLRPASNLNHIAAERAVCLGAYRNATRARDTRSQHAAERPAIRATCAELAMAVGKSPSAWRGR